MDSDLFAQFKKYLEKRKNFAPADLERDKTDKALKDRGRTQRQSMTNRNNECFRLYTIYNYLRWHIDAHNRKAGDNIPQWTLYQLRHAAYTANSLQYGVEIAAKIAGHTSLAMAETYDHSMPFSLRFEFFWIIFINFLKIDVIALD